VGGNPELVIEGSTGRLVPAGDPLALSESIRRYLDNPDERVAHGTEGRRRAEERFSVPAMVEGYMSVYEAVLNRKRTGRAHAA
jgi:glycosyltransferase involved in cell wall biosynthesis